MGENIYKWGNWQRINLQNIQAAPAAQYHKNKQPNQIVGRRAKQTFLQRRCCCSVTQSCATLCNSMECSTPGFPVLHYFPGFAQTHVHWVNDAIQPSHPLLPPSPALSLLQALGSFPMTSLLFTSGGQSWSFSISPSSENWGLISFRIDLFDLLAVQGTLKSLLQHHSSKASILWLSALFMVQLSHPYMTTGKTTALTRRTFAGKVISLLFKMLLGWS